MLLLLALPKKVILWSLSHQRRFLMGICFLFSKPLSPASKVGHTSGMAVPSSVSCAYRKIFVEQTKYCLVVVMDGDSQEIMQLKDAMNTLFTNAYIIQCSWNIIDRGWHKKVKVSLGGHSRRRGLSISVERSICLLCH
jgi:hypothetical protein